MRTGREWVIIQGGWGTELGLKQEEIVLCVVLSMSWCNGEGGVGVVPLPVKPIGKHTGVSRVYGCIDGWIASL